MDRFPHITSTKCSHPYIDEGRCIDCGATRSLILTENIWRDFKVCDNTLRLVKNPMKAEVILQNKFDLLGGYITFRYRFPTMTEAEQFVQEWNDNNKTHHCGVEIVKLTAQPINQ